MADLATVAGRDHAVAAATELAGGALQGVVTCAGLAGSPSTPGSILASVNYFGTVDVLNGLRPLLGAGAAAVAISSNSTTVQPAIPAELVEACLDHDEPRCARLSDECGSLAAYPASKLAVAHWVRREATGRDWAGSGLRLNAIAPGLIDTPMVAGMRADPETGPVARPAADPGPAARPARGDRRSRRVPAGPRRGVLLRLGALLRRRQRRAAAHPGLAGGLGHLGAGPGAAALLTDPPHARRRRP